MALVQMQGRCDAERMTSKDDVLNAVLPHVVFDGWSRAAMTAAAGELEIDEAQLTQMFPRGPVDLALAWHARGDAEMVARLRAADLDGMRYRDRIALGVRLRLEVADRELVRRAMALFALPQHAALGSAAVWGTASLIWETLGDTSRDINWYTKRATLSAVYSATVLYWLGDDSEGSAASWAFLDRRIEDVMQIEKVKGKVRESGLFQAFMRGPGRVLDHVRAPRGGL